MVFEKIASVVSEQFSVEADTISMDTTFEDLGADSLDIVELSMALEEEFDVGEMADDDMSGVTTIGDLVKFISAKLGEE